MQMTEEQKRNRQKRIREARRRKRVFRQRLVLVCVFGVIAVIAGILIKGRMDAARRENAAKNWVWEEASVYRQAETERWLSRANQTYREAEETRKAQLAAEEAQRIEEENRRKEEELQASLSADEQKWKDASVHFVAAGDNLIHERVYSTQDYQDALCCYDALYDQVKDYISAADLAAINQETIFIEDPSRISGYPYFGTPVQIGDALVNAGFDIVECATNHTADKLDSGISDTINYWRTEHPEITLLGIHDTEQDAQNIRVVESKGIRIALLNYTNVMNVEYTEYMPEWTIDLADESRIYQDVAAAKEIADVVIVFLHDGNEYDPYPSDSQMYYQQVCLNAGVDVLICAHSHVLEGFNTVTGETGNQMLVYYGLGNFISSQLDPICLLGGIADFYINKDPETGVCRILYPTLVPVVTHFDFGRNYFATFLLSDYSDALAAQHSVTEATGTEINMDYLNYYAEIAQQALY